MRPGDVLITNDAWLGTGHMSDVSVLKPIFHRDRLVAFSATTSHMPDIGGRHPPHAGRGRFEARPPPPPAPPGPGRPPGGPTGAPVPRHPRTPAPTQRRNISA